jgi:hypothetical protein
MWDFVMDKSGAVAGFHRELRFHLPLYIPSASPQSSSPLPEAGTIGSGRSANSLTNQIKKPLIAYYTLNAKIISNYVLPFK